MIRSSVNRTHILVIFTILSAIELTLGGSPQNGPSTPQGNIDAIVAEDMRAFSDFTRSGVKKGVELLRPLAPSRIALWSQAAKNGNPDGQFLLGYCYSNGLGVESNKTESTTWFQKASDHNQPQAQLLMAIRYAKGTEVTKNTSEALRLAIASATAGIPRAQSILGMSYLVGDIVTKNPEEGLKWIRKAADQGHAPAQWQLGNCNRDGLGGLQQDIEAAMRWYRSATNLGDANAPYSLGMCYFSGESIAKDTGEAIKWFIKAADRGNVDAMVTLGKCYTFEWGVKASIFEASKWFRKAADLGNVEAQRNLGFCYSHDDTSTSLLLHGKSDLPANSSEALYWFKKALANGDLECYNHIGGIYERGIGIPENHSEAINWYMKGVNINYAQSMFAMSSFFMLKDPLYSYAWGYLGSLKLGKADSSERVYKEILSPEEMQDAEVWAKSWQPGTTEKTVLSERTLSDPATPVRRMNRALADGYYDTVRECVLEDQHRLLQVLEHRKEAYLNLRYTFKEFKREVSGSTAKITHNTPTGKSYITVVVRTGDRWKVDFKQTVLENN